MKYKDLLKIKDPNNFSWIKVKKYDEKQEESLIDFGHYNEAFEILKEHHKKETNFLISKCREMADKLMNYTSRCGVCTDDEI